jgi:Flp pilus assembly protein TadD
MRAQDNGAMDQFSAHLDRGWDLVARGDFAGAMVSAQKTLEIDAESPEAHNLVGYIHAAEGNAEQALEHYNQAIEIDETFVEAMLNAAEVLIHPIEDHEGALRMIDDALEFCQLDDEIADALLLKVDVLLHAGQHDAARRTVQMLPEGPFENRHLDFLVGRARFEAGDLDGAEPLIRRAVDHEPHHPEANYYLGLVLDARGEHHTATLTLLRTRELDQQAEPPPWALAREQFERRVQGAIRRLPQALSQRLEGALVVVADVPGAEVVADGIDPRVTVLIDDTRANGSSHVRRVFVYQKNIERFAAEPMELESEIARSLERELGLLFPEDVEPEPSAPSSGETGIH